MKFLASLLLALLVWAAPAQAQRFQPDSQVNVKSYLVANNATAIVVSSRAGSTLYGIEASNNSATIAYVKLYNAATATCGSGTPQARYMIPVSTTVVLVNVNGDSYVDGITMCVVTGIADSSVAAPAANAYIVNVHYK